ncbi:aldehyde oxidase GLOX [Physcomitrium patens]|uniref:aldehyde oxidase GLOX n=1 Tax=Physcomitrium patens TaxID=3218 RepID=UPI000D15D638|nr:aldehyde oxidase GLOX-like [Physcomitrium patens]|eukprot:XP_024376669.1 aldehyde oxidase GLOX-like [Physcomitrella patens]
MEFWNAPSRRKCGQWSLVIIVVAIGLSSLQAVDAGLGEWRLVTKNAGISAMHAAVAPVLGTVVLLHQTKTGPSNITFPDGRCRNITYDLLLKTVCYVHSVILDPTSEVVRPIMVMTDTQGSSGQFLGEGSLSQTGGDLEGKKRTSNLSTKCYTTVAQRRYCDWVEGGNGTDLLEQRWYFTNQLLPDGRQIILPRDTDDGRGSSPNNLYPFVHLLPTGQLYIFANRDSILYDYNQNVVVRKFDKIPDNPRNYPSGSSSVMLPLVYNDNFKKVEILVCGGAATGSVGKNEGQMECSTSCRKLDVLRKNFT